jgi:hypothetical protein
MYERSIVTFDTAGVLAVVAAGLHRCGRLQRYRRVVLLARRFAAAGGPASLLCVSGTEAAPLMQNELPQFDMDEVALLISAVQKALQRLKRANEARGGADPEFIEFGRRYSIILQKLELIAARQ